MDVQPDLIKRLMLRYPHRPAIYWADLLLTSTVTWGALATSTRAPIWSVTHAALLVVASIALLRAVYFVHEIVHLPAGRVRGFGFVWFLIAGMPAMIPRFMVDPHALHHQPASYGSKRDPEYAPVATFSHSRLIAECLVLFLAPPLLALRFGLIAPLSWIIPPLRRFTLERLSALATQPGYIRPLPTSPRIRRRIAIEEAACLAFVWLCAVLCMLRVLPPRALIEWWIAAGLALAINMVRTFVAHAYELTDERRATTTPLNDQLRDTLTLRGNLFTELIAPLGTRYHALHHLAPGLPYHALGAAHEEARLECGVLREGERRDLRDALAKLWRRSTVLTALRLRRAGREG